MTLSVIYAFSVFLSSHVKNNDNPLYQLLFLDQQNVCMISVRSTDFVTVSTLSFP